MLTQQQIDAYQQDGYVKVEGLFSQDEVAGLGGDMVRIIEEWGEQTIGWKGPWRDRYLADEERQNTKAVFLHNPQHYSGVWGRVIFHEKMLSCVGDLIGDSVQWHHTVLHAKPPEMGTPFPMHQDYPFYPHDGAAYVDCLRLSDTAVTRSDCSIENATISENDGSLPTSVISVPCSVVTTRGALRSCVDISTARARKAAVACGTA